MNAWAMLRVNVLSMLMWNNQSKQLMEINSHPWAFSLLGIIISFSESLPCLNTAKCIRVLGILGNFTLAFK